MGGKPSKQARQVRKNLCARSGPLNVLVIGRTGVGKSTFINSMQMALGHRWHQLATTGKSTRNDPITLFLKKYEMFSDNYMKVPVEGKAHSVCFWDCSGFTDHGDDVYVEFIGRTLDGYVPDKTNVTTQFRQDNTLVAVEDLRKRFSTKDKNRQFHRIVLVVEAHKELPTNLMEAVRRASQVQDRAIPLFLLITKLDKIGDNNKHEYLKRKDQALDILRLVMEDQKFCETYQYCNEVCTRDRRTHHFNPKKHVDEKLQTFCCNLTDPSYDEGIVYAN